MARGLHLKSHVSRDGDIPGHVAGKNVFYIEKGGEPGVKSSFCHVVSQLARGVSQSGPASWGYGSGQHNGLYSYGAWLELRTTY